MHGPQVPLPHQRRDHRRPAHSGPHSRVVQRIDEEVRPWLDVRSPGHFVWRKRPRRTSTAPTSACGSSAWTLPLRRGGPRSAPARGADATTGLHLAVLLAWFWFRRGHVAEGRRWLEGFLSATPAGEDRQRLRATGLFWAGHFACAEAKPDAARPFFEESLTLSTALGDTHAIAYALKGLGHAAWYSGEYPGSLAQQREAVRLLARTGDRWSQAWALGQLAGVSYDMGDHAAACGAAGEALALFRAAGDPWGCAWTLDTLGAMVFYDGDHTGSRP